jgi:hypothetical protein
VCEQLAKMINKVLQIICLYVNHVMRHNVLGELLTTLLATPQPKPSGVEWETTMEGRGGGV